MTICNSRHNCASVRLTSSVSLNMGFLPCEAGAGRPNARVYGTFVGGDGTALLSCVRMRSDEANALQEQNLTPRLRRSKRRRDQRAAYLGPCTAPRTVVAPRANRPLVPSWFHTSNAQAKPPFCRSEAEAKRSA